MSADNLQKKIQHPGFVAFEGLDLTGKTTIGEKIVEKLRTQTGLNISYNHNQGIIQNGLADDKKTSGMDLHTRALYYFDCYLKDELPSDPNEFNELIQDRHLPSLVFHSIITHGKMVKDYINFIDQTIKPKFFFLFECDYEERLMRAKTRSDLKKLELDSISSKKIHEEFTKKYREVINAFKIQYHTINTSGQSTEESLEKCMKIIFEKEIFMQKVSLNDLCVDFEPKVYESTADLRTREIRNDIKLKPIMVTRTIDKKGYAYDILKDGRHRAYASLKLGLDNITAFVNYQVVDSVDPSTLTRIKEFTFK